MSNQEILTKAVQKAIDGGWKPSKFLSVKLAILPHSVEFFQADYAIKAELVPAIIFNHDFAKALWGEFPKNTALQVSHKSMPLWKLHLQRMVIAEDPIKYLGENI